jgi:hypothetical protein
MVVKRNNTYQPSTSNKKSKEKKEEKKEKMSNATMWD